MKLVPSLLSITPVTLSVLYGPKHTQNEAATSHSYAINGGMCVFFLSLISSGLLHLVGQVSRFRAVVLVVVKCGIAARLQGVVLGYPSSRVAATVGYTPPNPAVGGPLALTKPAREPAICHPWNCCQVDFTSALLHTHCLH